MTKFWTRAAMAGLAGGALAACTTSQYPVAEGQTPREPLVAATPNYPIVPQTEAAQAQPAPAAVPSGGAVASQALPPAAPTTAPRAAPVAAQPLTTAAQATPATRTAPVAAGRVVDAPGRPVTYEVQPGDTLYAISRKLETSVERLAADNNLAPPYTLRVGQRLKGPAPTVKAYVVEPGDTLYAVGRRFGVSAQQIAQANNIQISAPIEIGQRLVLPAGHRDAGPSTRTVAATPPAATPPREYARPSDLPPPPPPPPPSSSETARLPSGPRPYTPSPGVVPPPPPPAQAQTPTQPMIATGVPPTDLEVAAAGKGVFAWPVKGEVISGFGPKGGGQRNDGLNIRADAGSQIRAAAAGEVVYAGDQVPGFGNLVLIKHDGGWVTAYAHMGRIDVKMRDFVGQGQQLGLVGSSGGVSEPQLHFEVRYAPSLQDKARPIDPALVLPN